jgi:hypothetical protein
MDARPQGVAAEPPAHVYRCFGIAVQSRIPFPGTWGASPAADATTLVEGEFPPWAAPVEEGWRAVIDRESFVVKRSATGEHRFLHGDQTLFQLSADHRTLVSASGAARSSRWWRILLDSVLFTVSLLRGNEALHAGAVRTPAGAVAVAAGSGGGKSTLLGQLVREGCELVTDDVLVLQPGSGQVSAAPGPPFMTLPRDRAHGLGTPICNVDDEVWVTVPVVSAAIPLWRVVLLDRRAGAQTAMEPVQQPLFPLLTHLLNFPRTRERELTRFSLASAVTERSELWRLVADVKTSPQALAAHVLERLCI